MVDKKQLEEVYKQNLENDIIDTLSKMKGIDFAKGIGYLLFQQACRANFKWQLWNRKYGCKILGRRFDWERTRVILKVSNK